MSQNESTPSEAKAHSSPIPRVVIAVALLVGLIALGKTVGAHVPQFTTWVDGLGSLGPIVFILGYTIAAIAFIPASIMTLAAGAIFGFVQGTIYVLVAATLGSSLAFLIARHAARAAIEKRIDGDARFESIDRAVGEDGRKIVFLLRLSPIFPFSLLNYALGLTQVSFSDYVTASIGMLPGTMLYVYSGKIAGDVAAVAGGVETQRGPGQWALLVVGLLATLVVTIYVTRIARRALDASTNKDEPA